MFLQFVLNFYIISSRLKIFTVPSISNEKMLFSTKIQEIIGFLQITFLNVPLVFIEGLSSLLTPFEIMNHCDSKLLIFIAKVCLDTSAFKLEMVRIAHAFWHNDRSRSSD